MLLSLLLATSSTAIDYPDYGDVWKEAPILSKHVSSRSTYYAVKESELALLSTMWTSYTVNEKQFLLEQLRKAVTVPELSDVLVDLYELEEHVELKNQMLRILGSMMTTAKSRSFLETLIQQENASDEAYFAYVSQDSSKLDLLRSRYSSTSRVSLVVAMSTHEDFKDIALLMKALGEVDNYEYRLLLLKSAARLASKDVYEKCKSELEKAYYIKSVSADSKGTDLLMGLFIKQSKDLQKVILERLEQLPFKPQNVYFFISKLKNKSDDHLALILDCLKKFKLNEKQLTQVVALMQHSSARVIISVNDLLLTYPHKKSFEPGLKHQLNQSLAHQMSAIKYIGEKRVVAMKGLINKKVTQSTNTDIVREAFYAAAYLKANIHKGFFNKLRKKSDTKSLEGAAFYLGYTAAKGLLGHLRFFMTQGEVMSVREQGMLGMGLSGAPQHKQLIVDVMNYLKETKKGGPVNSASVRAYGAWAIGRMNKWDPAYGAILEQELTKKIIKIPGEPATYDSSYVRHNSYLSLCKWIKKGQKLETILKKSKILYKDSADDDIVHFEALIGEGEEVLTGKVHNKTYSFDRPEWKLLLDDTLDKE